MRRGRTLEAWLSLSEYSNKYGVSISTLRRRIRSGQLVVHLKNGKYFLKDRSLKDLKKLKDSITAESTTDLVSDPASESLPYRSKNLKTSVEEDFKLEPVKLDSVKLDQGGSPVVDKLLESQMKLCQQLELKDRQILDLQNKLMDFRTLCALLEKENKQLKSISQREQVLEDWLDGSDFQSRRD